MEYFTPTGTDLVISRIGIGCEQLGGTDWGRFDLSEVMDATRAAVDCGVTLFDTADVYGLGRSETNLKAALGSKRHDMVIVTKFGVNWKLVEGRARAVTSLDASPEHMVTSLERSLERLGLDCIPIYMLHWPDPNTPIRRTVESLLECRARGKIRYPGISNPSVGLLEEVKPYFTPSVVELAYSLIHREEQAELLDYCVKNHIPVIAYGALAQGLLTGKYPPDRTGTFLQATGGPDWRIFGGSRRIPARSACSRRWG